MRKRLLHVIPTLDRAGAEKQMTLLVKGLPADEFEVHVCALTRGGPLLATLEKAGIPTTVIGKRWKIDPRAYWALRQLMGRLKPDLVHTWLFAANAYGRAAGRSCGVKCLVAGERCVDPWKGRRDLRIDRYLAKRTARIVANSPGVRDFYVGHGLPEEKFTVIPNGIPPAAPSHTTREALLDELGLPEDSHLIGIVGRLWPQKRVKDAIWAADLLKVIRDDVHLLIIGDGPQRNRLRRFREQVEIRDKVHFLGHRQDAAGIIPHLDMLWSTSDYEGQSNSIMEAMSSGVPVVATDIPGTRDLVVHEETGYLIPCHGQDTRRRRAEFARYANRLLEDDELAGRMSESSRERMVSEFSVGKMVERHVELYRELLG